ncbi:hypothetical protein [Pseudomonas sp. 2835]|uniref:hypothetical protein n=1 Tax=Pseudomonas sp. 2835 TaxID=3156451 RepID=UPI003D21FDF1
MNRFACAEMVMAGMWAAMGQVQASEPSSLYFRCSMTKAQYATVMAARPGEAAAFTDWQQWFDSKEMYGGGKVDTDDLRPMPAETLSQIAGGGRYGSLSEYDEKAGVWRFALLQFSENYGAMISMLAPLRSVAPYCAADSDSFMLVYSYIWGDGDNAYLTLNGRSQFAQAPTPAQRAEADAVLAELLKAAEG